MKIRIFVGQRKRNLPIKAGRTRAYVTQMSMPLLFLSQLAHVEELLSELGPGEEDGEGDADEDWENVESTDEEEEMEDS